jgi:hypothetical protein
MVCFRYTTLNTQHKGDNQDDDDDDDDDDDNNNNNLPNGIACDQSCRFSMCRAFCAHFLLSTNEHWAVNVVSNSGFRLGINENFSSSWVLRSVDW